MADLGLGEATLPDYLDFHYEGPSFDGHIEIEVLAKELEGLNQALRIALAGMIRQKRTNVLLQDVVIYVEPLENGSFRKRIRVIIRNLNKNAGAYTVGIGLCGLVLNTIAIIKARSVTEVMVMTPAVQTQIGDSLKVQLLSDKEFIKGIAAATSPLSQHNDRLTLAASPTDEVGIGLDEKLKFQTLAGTESPLEEREKEEILVGKIIAINLDAAVNQIGFKVDNKGTMVNCRLVEDIDREEKKALLDQWVAITGTSVYRGGKLDHIEISSLKVADPPAQTKIELP